MEAILLPEMSNRSGDDRYYHSYLEDTIETR